MPSNLVLNHFTVSSLVTLCCLPILLLHRLLLAIRAPGRLLGPRISHWKHRVFQLDSHAAVKVHAVDTNGRVILDTKIDVFRDTETKVARVREVLLPQLIFLDLETTFEDFFGFGPPDGNMDRDLFISADTERPNGVAGFACDIEIL